MYLLLHCHHQNDSCIKMGSNKSHFNVSLTEAPSTACTLFIPTRCPPPNQFLLHASPAHTTRDAGLGCKPKVRRKGRINQRAFMVILAGRRATRALSTNALLLRDSDSLPLDFCSVPIPFSVGVDSARPGHVQPEVDKRHSVSGSPKQYKIA